MHYLLFILIPLFAFANVESSTVLITGANRGLGLEFARQYKAKGYNVIGTTRKPNQATELNRLGVRVEQLDVADKASVESLARRLAGVPIDILINNAGVLYGRSTSLEDLDIDLMTSSFAINSTGPLLVTQALLPNLRSGKQKRIINLTSTLGSIERNSGGMYPYRASKAALNQINKTLAIELGGEGFVCIAIHPGWVRTEMGGRMATYSPAQSVGAMIKVIDKLNRRSNGRYIDYKGNSIPW